eukprot:1424688-Rhodomonas_salina.2
MRLRVFDLVLERHSMRSTVAARVGSFAKSNATTHNNRTVCSNAFLDVTSGCKHQAFSTSAISKICSQPRRFHVRSTRRRTSMHCPRR